MTTIYTENLSDWFRASDAETLGEDEMETIECDNCQKQFPEEEWGKYGDFEQFCSAACADEYADDWGHN